MAKHFIYAVIGFSLGILAFIAFIELNYRYHRVEWETLTTGALALAAAGITAIILKNQIDQAEEHHSDQLQRKSRAARALAANATSKFYKYYDLAKNQLIMCMIDREHSFSAVSNPSDSDLDYLLKVAEASDDKISDAIEVFMAGHQIFVARVSQIEGRSATDLDHPLESEIDSLENLYCDCVEQIVRLTPLYDLGRERYRKNGRIVDVDQFDSHISMDFYSGVPKELQRIAKERTDRFTPP